MFADDGKTAAKFGLLLEIIAAVYGIIALVLLLTDKTGVGWMASAGQAVMWPATLVQHFIGR